MADKAQQHYRILYYKGAHSIIGVGDLFMDAEKQPPENKEGAFIVSDNEAKPLDWDTIKNSAYVQALPSGVRRMIELTLREEATRSASLPPLQSQRPPRGKDAMILDDKKL